MSAIKRFFKELKRVAWLTPGDAFKSFVKVIIFISVVSLILFGMGKGFEAIWNALGVGIHG